MRVRRLIAVFVLGAGLMAFVPTSPVSAEPEVPGAPVVVIAAQNYWASGTVTTFQTTEAQVLFTQQVRPGDVILVRNMDGVLPTAQHTLTSCVSPCRTLPEASVPTPSGVFDTGFIASTGGEAQIDTAGLAPGLYEYFCRPHPWMRGAFAIQ